MQQLKIRYLILAMCALAWLGLSNQAFADDPPAPPGLVANSPTTGNGTSTSTVGTSTSSTNSGPTETVVFAALAVVIYLIWQKSRQAVASRL